MAEFPGDLGARALLFRDYFCACRSVFDKFHGDFALATCKRAIGESRELCHGMQDESERERERERERGVFSWPVRVSPCCKEVGSQVEDRGTSGDALEHRAQAARDSGGT
ncbi:hypothetical protein GOP47_0007918 [Adiantum capillus-veneris]|uniref:Uncharacterized protein n=1 Tax=Adiantum capillus-veneris TaxID=13818 RepID=A0A9D4V1Z5_ADICA|nr:hypothetical protein GOP47_0007918 [Adiantum capillus-veneris]